MEETVESFVVLLLVLEHETLGPDKAPYSRLHTESVVELGLTATWLQVKCVFPVYSVF